MIRALTRPLARSLSRRLTAPGIGPSIAVPGAPTGVSAVAGNAQATVSWTAPVSTGGGPITGYRITASTGQTATVGATTSGVVTGLTNGVAVTFTVQAQNAGGYGPASSASASVTPAAETLGPELLSNGGFDTDTVWAKGSGWMISGGTANNTGSATLLQTFTALPAGTYKLVFDVASYTSGLGVFASIQGGATVNGTVRNAVGTYTEYLSLGGQTAVRMSSSGTSVFSIDNVSLKQVL